MLQATDLDGARRGEGPGLSGRSQVRAQGPRLQELSGQLKQVRKKKRFT